MAYNLRILGLWAFANKWTQLASIPHQNRHGPIANPTGNSVGRLMNTCMKHGCGPLPWSPRCILDRFENLQNGGGAGSLNKRCKEKQTQEQYIYIYIYGTIWLILVTRPLLKDRNRRREKTNIYGTPKFQNPLARTDSCQLSWLGSARLSGGVPLSKREGARIPSPWVRHPGIVTRMS